uniref:Uncharacterized protein n=1 Tax=Rhizophora mucronata TaxID=61149 RepID=A0A2P2K1Y8_RHIMU
MCCRQLFINVALVFCIHHRD